MLIVINDTDSDWSGQSGSKLYYKLQKLPVMVVHVFDPSFQEAEASASLPHWDQPCLRSEFQVSQDSLGRPCFSNSDDHYQEQNGEELRGQNSEV